MRINQYIASSSGLSRRAADAAVAAGRITVNGQNCQIGQLVDARDQVTLDGVPLVLRQTHTYVLLHKPAGYVSSRARQGGAPTLYDLLPAKYATLRIAGRLDQDSSGLILLSDDGDFIQAQSHPSAGKMKVYDLTLESPLTEGDRSKLEDGVMLTDGPSRLKIIKHDGKRVKVALGEGRNRQLRRTLGALGYTIRRLHRLSIGDFELGDLPSGAWQEIDAQGSPVS